MFQGCTGRLGKIWFLLPVQATVPQHSLEPGLVIMFLLPQAAPTFQSRPLGLVHTVMARSTALDIYGWATQQNQDTTQAMPTSQPMTTPLVLISV